MTSPQEAYAQQYAILFVDDEEKSLRYFKRAYSQYFNILTASNVDEAVTMINHHAGNIAVLLTDKRMPQKSGLELLKWVKKVQPQIVRLLTTAFSDPDDTINAINSGEVFRYIPKPWHLDKLLEDLKSAMNLYLEQQQTRDSVTDFGHSASTLAGHMAHELRTPLLNMRTVAKGIKKYLPTLVDTYQQAVNQKIVPFRIPERHLQTLHNAPEQIERNINQANTIIDTLLINTQADHISGDELSYFSISDCIDNVMDQYCFDYQVTYKTQLNLEDDFIICGSEILLKHILLNLLTNATYAISSKHEGEISITLEAGTAYNYLHFRDTGTGIPDNIIPLIFEDYFSTKPAGKGTGLGLSFCRKVMTSLGGDIYCFSDEGLYTEFMLRFPKVTAPAETAETGLPYH